MSGSRRVTGSRAGRTPAFVAAPLVLLLLFPAASCSLRRSPAAGAVEEGAKALVHVTFREKPLPEARVEWRTAIGDDRLLPAAAAVTDADGTATVLLPPGRYFLVARWCAAGGDCSGPLAPGDRFAYFGGNPVYAVPGIPLELYLGLEEHRAPPAAGEGEPQATGVSGVVTESGNPIAGVHVFAYSRTDSGFRDPGLAVSAPTGEDGGFLLLLPPGSYYLVARKRASGEIAGPLRKGDSFGYYPANPVPVLPDRLTRVVLPAARLKLRNVPAYSAEYPAPASIEGRILDRHGRPVPGVYAALYDNPDLLNRPVFLSDVTKEDGRYRLPVPVPGRYFLGSRSGYGGSPAPGDYYGRYEGSPDHALTVRTGDHLTGTDIVVYEVW